MNRKAKYKDIEKYKETKRRQQQRHRKKYVKINNSSINNKQKLSSWWLYFKLNFKRIFCTQKKKKKAFKNL